MKREILFRAIKDNVSDPSYIYGQLVYDSVGKPRITTLHQSGEGLLFHACIPGTEEQYTGMVDKNGKKIFEGNYFRNKDGEVYGPIIFGFAKIGRDDWGMNVVANCWCIEYDDGSGRSAVHSGEEVGHYGFDAKSIEVVQKPEIKKANSKIPTAEEFFPYWQNHEEFRQEAIELGKKFAAIHVEAALKYASETVRQKDGYFREDIGKKFIDKESILKAYPKENIK